MFFDICEFLLMCYFLLLGIPQMYVNTFMFIIINLDAFVANNKHRGSLVIKLLSSTYKARIMNFFLNSLCRYWNQLHYFETHMILNNHLFSCTIHKNFVLRRKYIFYSLEIKYFNFGVIYPLVYFYLFF
jgi:hypothetical protein